MKTFPLSDFYTPSEPERFRDCLGVEGAVPDGAFRGKSIKMNSTLRGLKRGLRGPSKKLFLVEITESDGNKEARGKRN